MKKSELKFLVVGAGAVGGVTAALLRKNGVDVEIVCKYDDYASMVSVKGLKVSGICSEFSIDIPAYASVSQVRNEKDIILLATKATDMIEAAQSLNSILKKDGFVISLQNGFCEDELGQVVGENRIIGCVTGWGATMESHGNFIMTSKGDFILGYPNKISDDLLTDISEILSSVVHVRITDNIQGHLYSKLIINSCITSLGALCGLYLGRMLRIGKVRKIIIEIVREAVEVADSMNVKIEVFAGKLDFKIFLKGRSFYSDFRRHIFLLAIGYKYRKLKSSSLQSLERRKPTEIEYLNGYIVRKAKEHEVSVPVNSTIVHMIHQIEQQKREISVSNFNDPFFDRFS